MQSADRQNMYDSCQLITHPDLRVQACFLPKNNGFKNRRIFSCCIFQDLSAFLLHHKHCLMIAGICGCFFQKYSFFHKIINMAAGIILPAVKTARICWAFHFFQDSFYKDLHSRLQLFFFFQKYSYIINWKFF